MAMVAAAVDCPVEPVEAAGLDGDMLEAQAFAYLAVRVAKGWPTSCPGTTGVRAAVGRRDGQRAPVRGAPGRSERGQMDAELRADGGVDLGRKRAAEGRDRIDSLRRRASSIRSGLPFSSHSLGEKRFAVAG